MSQPLICTKEGLRVQSELSPAQFRRAKSQRQLEPGEKDRLRPPMAPSPGPRCGPRSQSFRHIGQDLRQLTQRSVSPAPNGAGARAPASALKECSAAASPAGTAAGPQPQTSPAFGALRPLPRSPFAGSCLGRVEMPVASGVAAPTFLPPSRAGSSRRRCRAKLKGD